MRRSAGRDVPDPAEGALVGRLVAGRGRATVQVNVTATQPGIALVGRARSRLPGPVRRCPPADGLSSTHSQQRPDGRNVSPFDPRRSRPVSSSSPAPRELTIPPGGTGRVGVSLRPSGAIPAPGTMAPFSVVVTGVTSPALTATEVEPFTVPEIHGVALTAGSSPLNTTPGVAATATLTLTAVGNVPEVVDLTSSLPSGLAINGLGGPIALAVGETKTVAITLTPSAATPLNSTLTARITATSGGMSLQTLAIPVRVAVPGADAIADASVAARAARQRRARRPARRPEPRPHEPRARPDERRFQEPVAGEPRQHPQPTCRRSDPVDVRRSDLTAGRDALAAATTAADDPGRGGRPRRTRSTTSVPA